MKYKLLTLASLTLAAASPFAHADNTFIDIGYSPKSGKVLEAIGLGAYQLKDNGMGLFINGAFAINPTGYTDTASYGTITERADAPYMFNGGMTFSVMPADTELPLYKSIHSYIGVGYGAMQGRAKDSWGYWGNETSRDKSGLNVTGGFILGFDTWGINLGFNSYTQTVYIGVGMKTQPK